MTCLLSSEVPRCNMLSFQIDLIQTSHPGCGKRSRSHQDEQRSTHRKSASLYGLVPSVARHNKPSNRMKLLKEMAIEK